MKSLSTLFVVLENAKRNAQTLHWYVRGINFDVYHNTVTSNFIDMLTEDIDGVAEFMIRYDVAIPIATEEMVSAIKMKLPAYKSEEVDCTTVAERMEELSGLVYNTLLEAAKEAEQCDGCVDVRTYLEDLIVKYSKEYKFFAKSRIK